MARVVPRLLAMLLALLLLFGGSARAVEDTQAARERTGHTELSGPSRGAVEPPVAEVPREAATPADAPRIPEEHLRLPPVAAGFSTYDGGWFRITYHPTSRERIEPLIAASEDAKRELEDWLGKPVLGKVRIDVARTPGEMETLA